MLSAAHLDIGGHPAWPAHLQHDPPHRDCEEAQVPHHPLAGGVRDDSGGHIRGCQSLRRLFAGILQGDQHCLLCFGLNQKRPK